MPIKNDSSNHSKSSMWFENVWSVLRGRRSHSNDTAAEDGWPLKSLASEGEITVVADNPKDGASGDFHAQFSSSISTLGKEDARAPQRPELAEAVLKSRVELDGMERRARALAAIEAKESRLQIVDQEKARLAENVDSLRLLRFRVSPHPLLPPRATVSLMALIYLVFGLVAFVAEVPLSIQLVNDGLRFNIDGQGDLTGQTALFLAFVLCLFGLGAKLAWDSFLDVRAKPSVRDDDTIRDEVSKDWRHTRLSKICFLGVNGILTACTVCSLLAISNLRASVEEYKPYKGLTDISTLSLDKQNDFKQVSARRVQAGKELMFWLTLTLPLLGAVSCITGASQLKADHEDRNAFRALKDNQTRLAKAVDESAKLKHDILSARQTVKQEEADGATQQAFLKMTLDIYRHGFARGHIIVEEHPQGSLYDLQLQALRRQANRRMRDYAERS